MPPAASGPLAPSRSLLYWAASPLLLLLLLLLNLAAGVAGESLGASGTDASSSGGGGGSRGNLTLDFPPSRNLFGDPVGTVTRADVAGRQVYYEVPQAPVGILAMFHGCSHNAYDFWYRQPGCEECRGLPEEASHTKQALSLGYAVVAINSLDRGTDPEADDSYRCFSYSDDKDGVVEALRTLIEDLELQDLPLYFGGISSGASFALKLPNEMPGEVAGVISEVLAVDPDKDEFDWASWPPVAFVAMEHDPTTNDRIARNQEALRAAGVAAQTINVPERVVYWPSFFSDQASDVSPELSEKIVLALVKIGVLDEAGWIVADPRHGIDWDWRGKLQSLVPELDGSQTTFSVEADASDVSELLNTAYSMHEIVGDYTAAILRWFEGGASEDLQQLAEEYVIRRPALLKADRLQPGQKPATAGDPPVQPWLSPPLPAAGPASPL